MHIWAKLGLVLLVALSVLTTVLLEQVMCLVMLFVRLTRLCITSLTRAAFQQVPTWLLGMQHAEVISYAHDKVLMDAASGIARASIVARCKLSGKS
jgi:hypothetical protein